MSDRKPEGAIGSHDLDAISETAHFYFKVKGKALCFIQAKYYYGPALSLSN